jgi:flavin reductase (DIM6/NTAB) family NADH-FMN oxidoreductase RutF
MYQTENGSKRDQNEINPQTGLAFPTFSAKGLARTDDGRVDPTALFRIGYGLYLVTAREGEKDNGLIVNTVTQITNTPNRVAVTINRSGLTHEMILRTGKMNVNCLSVDTPFSIFEQFGMKSGRTVDKFRDFDILRTANGLALLPSYVNAFLSLEVEQYVDLGTHGMFLCAVSDAQVIGDAPTMTYDDYYSRVKPKPEKKSGYVCRVCGYVYEGEPLPKDFICPICLHGADDFEPLG